jgi:peptidoglycan hydrolase-like protein with peptidoglycan-binding domain
MSKLFLISEEEKNRILNLHESATNRQYLGEQEYGKYAYQYNQSNKTSSSPKVKEDINPKKLSLGSGGKNNPTQIEDVKKLQKKLMDLGFLKTDTMTPTGYFGELTQKALNQYNGVSKSSVLSKGNEESKTSNVNPGFIIIFAFPTYKPALEKGDIFSDFYAKMTKSITGVEPTKAPPLGHGGCVIIDSNGNSVLYEFGRYGGVKKGFGKVVSVNLGKIAKIQNGKLINAEEVASKAKVKTQGSGPQQPMEAVVLNLPNPSDAASYANVKEREYDLTDMSTSDEDANCGTFALQVGKAGGATGKFGVPLPSVCAPAPITQILTLRPLSLEFIKA